MHVGVLPFKILWFFVTFVLEYRIRTVTNTLNKMNSNWSSPKKNIIAGVLDLRSALSAGFKARLARVRNEDCTHPILKKIQNQDFRNYEFSIGYGSSINEINKSTSYGEYERHLALNFVSCFGTEEAVKRYYDTGEATADNFNSMGKSHLVRVDDLIAFYKKTGDLQRAEMYHSQYRTLGNESMVHFFDFFRYKHGSPYAIEKFRRKLWVVELLDEKEAQPRIPAWVKILNALAYPLKYVPQKSVLRMPKYTIYTFRVGAVTDGYSIEFQIPKKFSFR